MKYLYPILLLALLAGCRRNRYAEIKGTTNGFTDGTLTIKDQDGQTKFSGKIEDGKFDFHLTVDTIGYYTIRIKDLSWKDTRRPGYDFYLEPGTYEIVAQPESARQYPAITTTSTTETSLAQYYAIANVQDSAVARQIAKYNAIIDDKSSSSDDVTKAHEEHSKLLEMESKNKLKALKMYVDQYPQNNVEAHIMSQLDYDNNPEESFPIYQKFTDEQKKSTEGTEEGDKLNGLMKLAPGKPAPAIAGTTPDGKPFDPKSVQGKITLVEFWTSDNDLSKGNHQRLLGSSFSPLKTFKNFTVVSISLDSVATTWKAAIKDGGLSWTNISDLKAFNSPNAKNWVVNKIPTYILVDGDWKIIKRDVDFNDLADEVQEYMDKNHSK
jgi:hypothetical protein